MILTLTFSKGINLSLRAKLAVFFCHAWYACGSKPRDLKNMCF